MNLQSMGSWKYLEHSLPLIALVSGVKVTKWKPWNMSAPDIIASRAAQPVLSLWSWPKLRYLPCHRWYSDRCSKKASSACCSLEAAEAEDYGWWWCCTGYWHAAALWGWNSSDGACRKETMSPRHKATVSHKVGSQLSEALKGTHKRQKKAYLIFVIDAFLKSLHQGCFSSSTNFSVGWYKVCEDWAAEGSLEIV